MTLLPVTQMSAIWAACEPTASTIETTSPRRYGRRNERSRPNVRRYGTALTVSNLATGSDPLEPRELLANQRHGPPEPLAVCRDVEPAARAGGVGERDDGRFVEHVPLADALRQRRQAEEPPQRETADRDDEPRAEQLELPVAPEGAELLFARRRRPVAAAGRCATGVAARHRGAVEGGVEVALLELEPAAERPAGTPAPRQPFLSLDHARRLAEEIRALLCPGRPHGPRF